jgi:CubicO group peptidase (beta-lactamase class C family)
MSPAHEAARAVLERGLALRAFPAAVAETGGRAGAAWRQAFGRLSYGPDAPPAHQGTIFDLASLTKVIATTSLAMRQIALSRITLDTRVADVMRGWDADDRRLITIRQLLDHSSGLPARIAIWREARGREAYAERIASTPLERPPGTASVYSDVGFMLLGLLLEQTGGSPLDSQFRDLFGRTLDPIQYRPLAHLYERIAPTEHDPWRGRVLCGEVHDENAAALGGVAGHAGLFGTAEAVGVFARLVLRTFDEPTALGTPDLMRAFAARSAVPGSSRALGWDTALPTSSCGRYVSPKAIGHTGFTGTSLWIDPERDFYAVLLTNRVHPDRANEAFLPLRAEFHEALTRPGPSEPGSA